MKDNTYPSAYCTEPSILSDLTPLEAHKLSLEGKISKHTNFQCGQNCNFRLSLVNFKVKLTSSHKAPHFRTGKLDQSHNSQFCGLMQKHYHERARETSPEESFTFRREQSSIKVHIDLVNAVLASIPVSYVKSQSNGNDTELSRTNSSHTETKNIKQTSTHLKSLRNLVSYFRDWQKGELYTFVDSDNYPLDLNEHFVNLDQNNVIQPQISKVYFGKATVVLRENKAGEEYFLVRFITDCQMDNISIAPTFLFNNKPNTYRENGKIIRGTASQLKILAAAAKSKEEITLYYLGSFKKHSNGYINPSIPKEFLLKHSVFSKE
ncbi:TPA: hypothetical protein U1C85_000705 [Streptococcus suis]|nr:hypothetical protein [Streptococcus suis]